jgi:glycosyltransferase involved in cell wall biosynthesis
MKLLIITQAVDKNNPVLGFFHDWLTHFSQHVDSLTVICLEKGNYSLPNNVNVLSLGKEEKGHSKSKYILNFYKYIWHERKNYDAVFVHMNPVYVVLGGILWRLLGKKIGLWYTHKHVDFKLRLAALFSNIIFTASPESFRLKTSKLVITGHGIDTHLFSPGHHSPDSLKKLLTIGRISPVKDYDTLISAVSLLKQKKPNVHTTIVGGAGKAEDAEYIKRLHEKVNQENLSSVITFAGPVHHDGIVSYLHNASIFVHMSETGSLDKAVLEAMSAGLVVVSSNDAMKNVLGQYNLVFKKKDSEDLARIVTRLLENPGELETLSKKMREYVVENHNIEKLIPSLIKRYT